MTVIADEIYIGHFDTDSDTYQIEYRIQIGNIFDYPLYSHKGIIIIITRTRKREMLHSILKKFLSETSFEEISGKLIAIEDNLVRIGQ